MENSSDPFPCPACGIPAARGVSRPRVISDYEAYECPVTGKWIEGRRAHEENLKRTGSRVLETGEREQAEVTRAAREQAFDKALDDTVEEVFDSLPAEKRERIGAELESGATAVVERT